MKKIPDLLLPGLMYLYYLTVFVGMIFWMNVLRQSAEYQYVWIWSPAAAGAILMFLFRRKPLSCWILVAGNWILALGLYYIYFIDGADQPVVPDGQSGMGYFFLAIVHWGFQFILFILALIASFRNNSSKIQTGRS